MDSITVVIITFGVIFLITYFLKPAKATLDKTFKLIGSGSEPAQHEIHIFLDPVNPSQDIVEKYNTVVQKWNETNRRDFTMKACYLCLIFRDKDFNEIPIKVMQSAVYYKNNSIDDVIAEAEAQANFFMNEGFGIMRVKIEASAYGISGVPQTFEDFHKGIKPPLNDELTKTYFEFHIKTKFRDKNENDPITDEEIVTLKKISSQLTKELRVPVPLSYNLNRDKGYKDGMGNQRFLNVRFREKGIMEIRSILNGIEREIKKYVDVVKIIPEYVWYDTNPKIDHGWIDFAPDEKEKLLAKVDQEN